jgi:amidophosphoribosyltransferase
LLKEHGWEHKLKETHDLCRHQLSLPAHEAINAVKGLYDLFNDDQLTDRIADLVKPEDMKAEVKIIFQKVEHLHKSCPGHTGDWYFTGDYPTPGGTKVVNRSFDYFMQGIKTRAY